MERIIYIQMYPGSADRADPGPCDTMIDVTEYLKTPGLPIDYLMDKIAMTC